jgi:cation diffusion facilitator CzcD-associated flavoprotein CzcO
MSNIPGAARTYRYIIAMIQDYVFTEFITKYGSSKRREIEKVHPPLSLYLIIKETIDYMKRSSPEEYHSILVPTYELGQKRRVFDTDYFASLHRSNVHLTDDPISDITPNSVKTKSGKEYSADVIILANGFHTQSFILPMKFSNVTRGISLDSSSETGVWRETGPEAYLGNPPLGFLLILTLM